MKFRAAVLHEVGGPLVVETVDAEAPCPDEVLVRIKASGLCHTDLEAIDGQLAFPLPIVLGHEAAGIVERVGDAVTHLKPGDPVVMSWNPHCGHCFYCDRDQPILCETYTATGPQGHLFDGTTRLSIDGRPVRHLMFIAGFAEFCIVPAQSAIKIPAEMPLDRACLIGCGVMTGVGAAIRVARPPVGSIAAVIGCGAVGLSAVQGARLSGCETIIAIDLDPRKLDLARAVGATHAVNARAVNAKGDDALAAVKALSHGRGADVIFESAGNETAFRLSAEAVRPGGQVVWLGKVNVGKDVAFRWGSLMGEKRIVRSSYGGARPERDFPYLARAYLDGKLKLDELVSRHIALDEINDGFAALRKGEVVRAVVTFPG